MVPKIGWLIDLLSGAPPGSKLVVNPYNSSESRERPGLVVKGPWRPALAEYVNKNGIKALYFNSSLGWKGEDFSFLAELPEIAELNILTSTASGLNALESLKKLEELSLTCATKDKVDFTQLPALKNCYIYWWSGATSIADCVGLEEAYFDKIKLNDFDALGGLKALKKLTLANTPMSSLAFLSSLGHLRELALLNCRKIESFEPVAGCKGLSRLTISGSNQLTKIDFLAPLLDLEVLDLSDNGRIADIEVLRDHTKMKAFSFSGSTNIGDGDLTQLEHLPKLAMLMFQPRRHYSHKLIKEWNWVNFNCPDNLMERK